MEAVSVPDLKNLQGIGMAYFLYLFLYSGLEFTLTFLTHNRFDYDRYSNKTVYANLQSQSLWVKAASGSGTGCLVITADVFSWQFTAGENVLCYGNRHGPRPRYAW